MPFFRDRKSGGVHEFTHPFDVQEMRKHTEYEEIDEPNSTTVSEQSSPSATDSSSELNDIQRELSTVDSGLCERVEKRGRGRPQLGKSKAK